MTARWTTLLIGFFVGTIAMASDFYRGRVDPKMRIIKGSGPLVQEVKVVHGGKTLFQYSEKSVDRFLDTAGLVKPKGKGAYFVTIWSSGAHSQIMYVHDLGKKGSPEEQELRQCRTNSAWPISLGGDENRLVIEKSVYGIDPKTHEPNIKVSHCQL